MVEADNPPQDSYIFVQKEAAEKIAGRPFGNRECQFSILTKPWFEYQVVHEFEPADFRPTPTVEVVLLRIKQLTQPLISLDQQPLYRDFIVYAFNATKPSLKKGLEDIFTHNQFRCLAKDLRFDLEAKPSELSFEQWLQLFRYFTIGVIEEKKQLVRGSEALQKSRQAKLEKIHRTRTAKDWLREGRKSTVG